MSSVLGLANGRHWREMSTQRKGEAKIFPSLVLPMVSPVVALSPPWFQSPPDALAPGSGGAISSHRGGGSFL